MGETRRRQRVSFTPELRQRIESVLSAMRGCDDARVYASPKVGKQCNACSLREVCLPKLQKTLKVAHYLRQAAGGGCHRESCSIAFVTSEDAYLALENENVVIYRDSEKAGQYPLACAGEHPHPFPTKAQVRP